MGRGAVPSVGSLTPPVCMNPAVVTECTHVFMTRVQLYFCSQKYVEQAGGTGVTTLLGVPVSSTWLDSQFLSLEAGFLLRHI